jgi:oligopeptidase B
MEKDLFLSAVVSLMLTFFLRTNSNPLFAQDDQRTATAGPPKAEKILKRSVIHGDTLVDNYFWLRGKSNPKVIEYLTAEDAYAKAQMEPTAALQETIYKEMLSHLKQTDVSVPYRQGSYYYYTRTEEGKQYPIYCRKQGDLGAAEQVVLDQNELARGFDFLSIGVYNPSDDGNLLAYSTDSTGYRQYALRFKNMRTGVVLPETIDRVNEAVWAADNKTIFYVTEDPVTKRSNRLFRHTLGSTVHDLVFEEKDELFDLYLGRSRDKAVLFLASISKTNTEYRYLMSRNPGGTWSVILPRQPDHEYDVEHCGDLFYIRTNKGAKNFRVVTAPVTEPSEMNWKEFVAHRPAVKVDAVDLFAGHAVLSEWENGLQQLEIIDLVTKERHRVEFPEPVYSAFLGANHEFETSLLRYDYQSLVTPSSVFDYDMNARTSRLLKQTEVPGGFDRTQYTSERVFATASDGTRIPISIVYRRSAKLDGSAPMLLYGYGSYGISIWPAFSSNRLSLLDRGMIFAIAHIRGGGELGEHWREEGRMLKKKNTFTDFIACAEYLIARKYTSADHLVIQGGSAGGMLMGVVVNMRPDLFKAVVAQVPFVDILNTMLDPSLPLTTGEYIEWGNPNEKSAYEYIKQYSPYDNIARQAYPSILVRVSLNDSQVPYWEGAKFVAKLRSMKTDGNPLLLKVNFGAGHSGSSGRYDLLREIAFEYAFMLWQAGERS